MLQLHEVVEKVLESVVPLDGAPVALDEALGSTLLETVVATDDTPPFDASAMDGYAVRVADLAQLPVTLPVVATSSSGRPTDAVVEPGTAVRILTGAVVPDGADCVVPVEWTDGRNDLVTVEQGTTAGVHIRRRGEVVRRGDVLIAAGTRLNAGHLGVIAGTGADQVMVRRTAEVAVVTTGDELIAPGSAPLGPGQIYDSNSTLMEQLVVSTGARVRRIRVGDDADALGRLLEELSGQVDLVLTSGGVSMGAEFDPLRSALAAHPVDFVQVAIKPAKPLAFGRVGSAAYLGLPGNPVSVVVAFELFARPLLRRLAGVDPVGTPLEHGTSGTDIERPDDDKTHLVPVRRTPEGTWTPTATIGSHALVGIAAADALAVLDPDVRHLAAGSTLRLLPLWR